MAARSRILASRLAASVHALALQIVQNLMKMHPPFGRTPRNPAKFTIAIRSGTHASNTIPWMVVTVLIVRASR